MSFKLVSRPFTALVRAEKNKDGSSRVYSLKVKCSDAAGNRAFASVGVTVTNKDSSGCASSAFSLAASKPSGWTASLGGTSLSLAPGAGCRRSRSNASAARLMDSHILC